MPRQAQAQQAPATPEDASPAPVPTTPAQSRPVAKKARVVQAPTLPKVFPQVQDKTRFDKAVKRAYNCLLYTSRCV